MATLSIANVSSADIYLSDLVTTLAAGATLTATRAPSDISRMTELLAQIALGNLTLSITYSADELATGLMIPPGCVDYKDNLPVASTDLPSGTFVIRKAFTALVTGAADDVTVYAVGALPAKFRVLDAWGYLTAATGASNLGIWTRAAGTGTQLSLLDSGTTGRVSTQAAWTATGLATPGASDGLFIRRSDRAVAGEVFLLCRIES
jgi:hypothetical protein